MDAGSTKGTRYPVKFNGSGGEFFKIWIVNIILSILTLYIYSAWAKVRTNRYFYGNTLLDGSSFEYHVKPMQILISRLVAAAILIAVTLGSFLHPALPGIAFLFIILIAPWAVWRSIKFNARMTSYRNVRFGFKGALLPMYLFQFILPFLPIIILGLLGSFFLDHAPGLGAGLIGGGVLISVLMSPWISKLLTGYFVGNYQYGKSQFASQLSAGKFYVITLLTILLALAVMLFAGALVAGLGFMLGVFNLEMLSQLGELEEGGNPEIQWAVGVGIFLFYAFTFIFGQMIIAYYKTRIRAHVYSTALLDNRVAMESTMTMKGLWWIQFSNLFLTVLTLGLFIPFAKVRLARYTADNTVLYSDGPLDEFVGEKREEVGAFGDELGDAFDMDMGIGI